MKLRNSGITIEISAADASRYIAAGWVKVDEQPELLPAAALPKQPAAQPQSAARKTKERGK